MYERTDEVKNLIDIINSIFAIDMTDKRRKPIFVQARMVYARLLRNKGYTLKYIGKTIGKDHATIIHYLDIIDMDLKHDESFRNKFNKISSMFFEDYDPIHNLDINQLKNKIFSMRSEINELYLENKYIRSKYESLQRDNERLLPIMNLVKERTPMGKEEIVVKKLNALLNSIN